MLAQISKPATFCWPAISKRMFFCASYSTGQWGIPPEKQNKLTSRACAWSATPCHRLISVGPLSQAVSIPRSGRWDGRRWVRVGVMLDESVDRRGWDDDSILTRPVQVDGQARRNFSVTILPAGRDTW